MKWEKVRLESISTRIGDGLHGTPKYDDSGEFFFINGNNLSEGKILIKEDTKRISSIEFDKIKKASLNAIKIKVLKYLIFCLFKNTMNIMIYPIYLFNNRIYNFFKFLEY